MDKTGQDFLRETIKVWQPYSEKKLNLEDAREICENMTGFLSLLKQWSDNERMKDGQNLCHK